MEIYDSYEGKSFISFFLIYNKNTYIIKKNFNLCPE